MNILIIGDVFGNVGKEMITQYLPLLRKDYHIDLVIMNVENCTDGKSISKQDFDWCLKIGVNCLTSGNHIFRNKDAWKILADEKAPLLRPANYHCECPGRGTLILNYQNKVIRISNLIGQHGIHETLDNPFTTLDNILKQPPQADLHFVDFHAETTSEKAAFARYFDGRVTAVYGTHTHVQTADARLLPKGTAFITDVGLTGPYESIIGVEATGPMQKLRTGLPVRFFPATGQGQLSAWILEINEVNNHVNKMQTIFISPQRPYSPKI